MLDMHPMHGYCPVHGRGIRMTILKNRNTVLVKLSAKLSSPTYSPYMFIFSIVVNFYSATR
jgi:hypothetical protein